MVSLYIEFFFILLICFISTEAEKVKPPAAQELDRVFDLPGQPSTPTNISQFSGYITVNPDHGRALFYWFFEAQTMASEAPLLLWLNGGPGCSSIGYGAAVELGPLLVKINGNGLEFNKHAWNKEANLLFVESPIGVGFSYTNTSSDLTKLDDEFVAEDAYSFLANWFGRFPQYQTHEFFLSGESYAGHYVPQLADLIYERNKDKNRYPFINLKGFIVGNPETDDFYDSKGLVEYAWSHAIISDQVYVRVSHICDFRLSDWTTECSEVMSLLFQQYREIDIYNVYAPTCLLNQTSSSPSSSSTFGTAQVGSSHSKVETRGLNRMRIFGGYDPCYGPYTEEYFNRVDVQKALHANRTGNIQARWKACNDSILSQYNSTISSVLPIYTKLIKAGLRIWVYSGDTDGRVPVIGTRYCMEALGLPLKTPWRPWYHRRQVGGRFVEYEGLTFVTLRGAGHLVPLNKPSHSQLLIHSFLWDKQLPTQK